MNTVFDFSLSTSIDDYDFKIDLGSVILTIQIPLYADSRKTSQLLFSKIKKHIDKLKKKGIWQAIEDESSAIKSAVDQLILGAYQD
jgi:hypothetical protein